MCPSHPRPTPRLCDCFARSWRQRWRRSTRNLPGRCLGSRAPRKAARRCLFEATAPRVLPSRPLAGRVASIRAANAGGVGGLFLLGACCSAPHPARLRRSTLPTAARGAGASRRIAVTYAIAPLLRDLLLGQ